MVHRGDRTTMKCNGTSGLATDSRGIHQLGVFDNKTVIIFQCGMSSQEITIDAIIDCISSSPLKEGTS